MRLDHMPLSHNVIDVSLSRAEQAALHDLILANVPHAAALEYAPTLAAVALALWLIASIALLLAYAPLKRAWRYRRDVKRRLHGIQQ